MPESASQSELTQLIQALERGDADARDRLIAHCQERLRLRVRQMLPGYPLVRRNENTSDVVQEVLLELNDTLAKLTPNDSRHFLCLASQQIRRTLVDLARKYGRRPQATTRAELTDGAPPPDPDDSTHDPALLARWTEVHDYIEGLPDDERALFDLLFYQDVPQETAAELLGLSHRTLKRNWLSARLRFMAKFGEDLFQTVALPPARGR